MKTLKKPDWGNNTPLPKFSDVNALRLFELRNRFGIDGPYARMICDLAFGANLDGGSE